MNRDGRFRIDVRSAAIPAAAIAFALAGAALAAAAPRRPWGEITWLIGLVATGVPVLWRTLRSMMRGHFATDIVAMLAIVAAIALREPLAGLIVVLMQTGGEALERYAEGRASRAVRALEEQAPRIAHRLDAGGVVDLPVEDVRVGDELLVRPGEMIPCDGVVVRGRSAVDTSRLTGEPMPVDAHPGVNLLSGTLNGDGSFVLRATALSRESQYARIVELVRSAEASKAPLQRLADRYAVWFTPATLLVCAVSWFLSHDATRVLAVLVVATPCPLILATPIAIIGGVNRAAARQIIVRTGGALEQLDGVTTAVLDKTGTLTVGEPRVSRVTALPPHAEREVLRLAAALEQHSGHLLARPIVDAATALGDVLPAPHAVREAAGRGVSGEVDGRRVSVGSRGFVLESLRLPALPAAFEDGATTLRAWVTVDGALAGVVEYADALRPGARELVQMLHRLGVRRTVLLSGDHAPNVRAVADAVGIDEAVGDLLPSEKVERVAALTKQGRVLMVGDGTNDAPALAQADVGIALAGHGGGIAAEAADAVVLVDDLARVGEAVAIGQRTMRIARQSIWAGLSLSAVAMLFAAAGHIPPIVGALLQEGIDVAVILNALRASAPGRVAG
ncbi:MAG TPA: heavy metal translocating P-type ATPase [Gemmatimonadaceae bacterium]|nr:heavy metal translocating P-type ATPase [Gemmatimonadaceae bacterium]